jgi:hypothetical protein
MSVTATILEDWQLEENDTQLRTQKRRETDLAAGLVKGWLEQADVSSLSIKRHFVGLTAFTTEVGDEQGSFTYHVGNGVNLTFASTSANRYLCTRDKIAIADHVIGEGWESQTWERVAKWAMVPGSYYEEAIPEEGEAYDDIEPPPEE